MRFKLLLTITFVVSGQKVVLKPNWVKECDERFSDDSHWDYVVTHPAVIEATAEWVAERLNGTGSIVICNALRRIRRSRSCESTADSTTCWID